MTNGKNWRSFSLDHKGKFSYTHLTIDDKIQKVSVQYMDRLLLKISPWGLAD